MPSFFNYVFPLQNRTRALQLELNLFEASDLRLVEDLTKTGFRVLCELIHRFTYHGESHTRIRVLLTAGSAISAAASATLALVRIDALTVSDLALPAETPAISTETATETPAISTETPAISTETAPKTAETATSYPISLRPTCPFACPLTSPCPFPFPVRFRSPVRFALAPSSTLALCVRSSTVALAVLAAAGATAHLAPKLAQLLGELLVEAFDLYFLPVLDLHIRIFLNCRIRGQHQE